MEKVNTKLEALNFCEERGCKVQFKKQSDKTPKHVVVSFAFNDIIGSDLVEAVNRTVELYNTLNVEREKLSWWKEHQEFYLPPSKKKV